VWALNDAGRAFLGYGGRGDGRRALAGVEMPLSPRDRCWEPCLHLKKKLTV